MRSLLNCTPTDTLLSVGALSFDLTTLDLFLPLTTGARLHLASHDVISMAHVSQPAALLRSHPHASHPLPLALPAHLWLVWGCSTHRGHWRRTPAT